MLHIDEGENPVSIQLLVVMKTAQRAAEFIQENTKTDIVDINMGCPVNKNRENEAGAMWLKDPDKIYLIINKAQSVLIFPHRQDAYRLGRPISGSRKCPRC